MRNWDYGFEVTRTESGYVVEVPVPGFNSSNVDITLKDGILSVNGKSGAGRFRARSPCRRTSGPEKIAATVADGMLSISLERHPESQPRRITVQ